MESATHPTTCLEGSGVVPAPVPPRAPAHGGPEAPAPLAPSAEARAAVSRTPANDGTSAGPSAGDAALAVLAVARPSPFRLGGGCRWIEGDPRAPGGPDPCGAQRELGRPYCRAHCLRAYRGLQRVGAATEALAVDAHSRPVGPGGPGEGGLGPDHGPRVPLRLPQRCGRR
jgi:hypothetical protein